MLNAETIADGAKKSTSRTEVFVRPLIDAAVKLIQSGTNMKGGGGERIVINYYEDSFVFSGDVGHKTHKLQIFSRGKAVFNVHWDDELDEEPFIHLFKGGGWEEAILDAARLLSKPN
jgi:hypothetical protein